MCTVEHCLYLKFKKTKKTNAQDKHQIKDMLSIILKFGYNFF